MYYYSIPFLFIPFISVSKPVSNILSASYQTSKNIKNDGSVNYITGMWKFSDKVPQEQLVEVAKKWAEDPKYLQLYVRKCSKDQYAIGFMYDFTHEEPSEGQNKKYMDPVMDSLKREFGNDLVGWGCLITDLDNQIKFKL